MKINIESLGNSKILNLLLRPAGTVMGSKLRRQLQSPATILRGADIESGQTVLEVGCGTGFFTIEAAQMIGDQGCLIAMDALSGYTEQVIIKVQASGLQNVKVIIGDALDTRLDTESIDSVLLFGVVPFWALPLNRLLPEMHRVLKPEGTLAVWMFPFSGLVPKTIIKSGLFTFISKRSRVYNYTRC